MPFDFIAQPDEKTVGRKHNEENSMKIVTVQNPLIRFK